jgi:hypothetical protein
MTLRGQLTGSVSCRAAELGLIIAAAFIGQAASMMRSAMMPR